MLPTQQSVQHVENLRFVIAIITLVAMAYWRLTLRLLLILAAVATAVGVVAILQIMHK